MSSPLDGRIRSIARAEAEALLGVPGGVQGASSAPTAEQMQQQITDLHEHLHHAVTAISALERRISTLEKTPAATDQGEQPTVRRSTRKTGGTVAAPE